MALPLGVRQKQERCPRRWPIRNHRKRHSKIQNAQFSSQQHFPRGVSPEGHNLQRLSDSLFYWFRDFLQGPVYTGPFFGRSTWKPNSGWTRRSGRASNAAHEARTRTTAHSRRPTASDAVGVALLRRLFASFADRLCRSGNPLGRGHVQRCPAAACSLHRLRPQGCYAPASRMGRRRRRLPAVPGGSRHRIDCNLAGAYKSRYPCPNPSPPGCPPKYQGPRGRLSASASAASSALKAPPTHRRKWSPRSTPRRWCLRCYGWPPGPAPRLP